MLYIFCALKALLASHGLSTERIFFIDSQAKENFIEGSLNFSIQGTQPKYDKFLFFNDISRKYFLTYLLMLKDGIRNSRECTP
jgi:hypothetical protein